MPSSLLGLALRLVVLPGLGYQLGHESRQPTHEYAGFRETVSLVFAGIIAISVSLFGFSVVRWIAPGHTPDVGQLLREPGPYIRDQLPYLASWTVAVAALATGLAYFSGKYLPRASGALAYESAWWRVFKKADNYKTHVGCELIDGTDVAGTL